jgi:hypothetical protein
MRHIIFVLLMLLLTPLHILAQSEKRVEDSSVKEIVMKQKQGAYLRVKLKTGTKVEGRLTFKNDDRFEIAGNLIPQQIDYFNVEEIKTGRSFGNRLKRDTLFALKTPVIIGIRVVGIAAFIAILPFIPFIYIPS